MLWGLVVSQGNGRPRRIVSWAEDVARGKRDTRQAITQVEFIDGGTVGPAQKE